MQMEMKGLLHRRIKTSSTRFLVLSHSMCCKGKDTQARRRTQHTKGAGSTGGHPSYGKHSWTINLISIMVTHEWNAVPCFMMANWCWYTPNVALINIGRSRELTQNWYISLLMKGSECSHLSLLASDGGLFTDGEQGQATRTATRAAEKIKQSISGTRFHGSSEFWSVCVDGIHLTLILHF